MAKTPACLNNNIGEVDMSWTTPQFVDMRFGFEITMYIANR
jgi:coenzyme PQQ precursor peptide PqqA